MKGALAERFPYGEGWVEWGQHSGGIRWLRKLRVADAMVCCYSACLSVSQAGRKQNNGEMRHLTISNFLLIELLPLNNQQN